MDDRSLRLLERLLKPLEDQLAEHKGLLKDIRAEVRYTNGRVTDHDGRLGAVEKLLEDRAKAEEKAEERAEDVAREHRWHWRELAAGLVFALTCGTAGELLHALVVGHF